jgi:predicted acyl esterase
MWLIEALPLREQQGRRMKRIVLLLLFPTVALGYTKTSYMVPMRDGLSLHTNVYAPADTSDLPLPVVLMRTPYNADLIDFLIFYLFDATDLRRYIVVAQDTRGRFHSEGIDSVFLDDGWRDGKWDGYDTIEWIAAQSWCDGKVGMTGISAAAITQYLAAGAQPPHLTCAVPVVGAWDLYNHIVLPGGEYREYDIDHWLAGQASSYMKDYFLGHPNKDDAWDFVDVSTRRESIDVPMLHVGGWYDIFSKGTVQAFCDLQYHGAPGALGNQKLKMGPWTHAAGTAQAGQITYPSNASVNLEALAWEWMDYWLKGEQNGAGDPAVEYYLMGPVESGVWWNEWREAAAWPVPCDTTPYYLADEGALSLAPPAADSLSYAYDPRNPVSTEGGNNLLLPKGPYNQPDDVWMRQDVLTFATEPLAQDVQIVGDVSARLYVSSDRYDTDFTAKLVDIYPDGTRMLICDGILMARHRNGLDREDLLVPGEISEMTVELGPTAYVFPQDHRIALAVSSSNYPRFRANPNVPEPVGQETDSLVATNTVYLGPTHPSAVFLPVVEPQAAQDPCVAGSSLKLSVSSNPFTGSCRLSIPVGLSSSISVTVLDLMGREVEGPHIGYQPAGASPICFGEDLAPGVYYVLVHTGDRRAVAKAVKIR